MMIIMIKMIKMSMMVLVAMIMMMKVSMGQRRASMSIIAYTGGTACSSNEQHSLEHRASMTVIGDNGTMSLGHCSQWDTGMAHWWLLVVLGGRRQDRRRRMRNS